jgi:hypothetical protein
MTLLTLLDIFGKSFHIKKVDFRILLETTCVSLRICSLCYKFPDFNGHTKVFLHPYVLLLFRLTPVANLHYFLTYVLSFSVERSLVCLFPLFFLMGTPFFIYAFFIYAN